MQDLRLAAAEPRIRALPIWSGPLAIAPLHGGLSNESYDVRDATGRYVVRFGRDVPVHYVFRAREVMIARAAHAVGFAAEPVHAEPGIMVSRFIEGRAFTEADVRANHERIARLVRDFHQRMPRFVTGPPHLFWVFHVIRDYARTIATSRNPLAAQLPAWLAIAERLEAVQTPLPLIFGHNDFMPGNLIDDGQKLWLIDYEYAGFSTGMFDLANIASNSSFSDAEAESLMTAYFGAPPSPELRRSLAAMMCASLLREVLWALASEIHMPVPGVDHAAYAAENLARFEAAMARYRDAFGELQ